MGQRRTYQFEATDAVREERLARIAVMGGTGSGKTLLSLRLATRMRERMGLPGDIYVIDTEHKSALEYAYSPRSKTGFRFKHVPMPPFDNSPDAYVAALEYAESNNPSVIIIDSGSHAWSGIGGVLELVDQATGESRNKDSFGAGWRKMSPVHNRFIERLMNASAHLLVTLRAEEEYVIEENERGKKEPRAVGLAPVQRKNVSYEFSMAFMMFAPTNELVVQKSRVLDRPELAPGMRYVKPAEPFCDMVIDWLLDADAPAGPLPVQIDPLADPDANRRAAAWFAAVESTANAATLKALAERAKSEPHDRMRADIMARIEKRRPMFATRGETPPASDMSDEERLRAIDEGRV